MINTESIQALQRASFGPHSIRPAYDSYCFSRIPATICQLMGAGPLACSAPLPSAATAGIKRPRNVILLFFDAFGYQMLQRSRHVPSVSNFFQRLEYDGILSAISSQFPSTTAAHVTTIQSGLPVAEHGVYEWYIYHSGLQRMVAPVLCSCTNTDEGSKKLTPDKFLPDSPFHDTLSRAGIEVWSVLNEAYAHSPYNRYLGRKSRIFPYSNLEAGFNAVADRIIAGGPSAYFLFYSDIYDYTCHRFGPAAEETANAADSFFSALQKNLIERLPAHSDTAIIITADHGQTAVDPSRIHYLDEEMPELLSSIMKLSDGTLMAPAGSPRDFFLHIHPDHVAQIIETLTARYGEIADICSTAQLVEQGFWGKIVDSSRILSNLGNVVVLPKPGESIFWSGKSGQFRVNYNGNHGGLSRDEMESLFGIMTL
ncbi:MAG: alkaline phosphatase family protein [Oligoflexia bacterium]|nr:alkaline phosphatase family protein [Oligoflexia bacterium]